MAIMNETLPTGATPVSQNNAPEIHPRSRLASRRFATRTAYVVGSLLTLLAIYYILQSMHGNMTELGNYSFSTVQVHWLILAALTYGVSLITTAMAWPTILRSSGIMINWKVALSIGVAAQFGKYLPGNIAHYLGRAAIAKNYSISLTDSTRSTLLEFVSALLAAGLISLVAILAMPKLYMDIITPLPALLSGLPYEAGLAALILMLLAGFAVVLTKADGQKPSNRFRLTAVAWLIGSFLLAGCSLFLVLIAFNINAPSNIISIIFIYALAWLGGFLVPGAPAGIGVREVILLALLTPYCGPLVAIIVSLAHRLLSTIVDAMAAAIGAFLLFSWRTRS